MIEISNTLFDGCSTLNLLARTFVCLVECFSAEISSYSYSNLPQSADFSKIPIYISDFHRPGVVTATIIYKFDN